MINTGDYLSRFILLLITQPIVVITKNLFILHHRENYLSRLELLAAFLAALVIGFGIFMPLPWVVSLLVAVQMICIIPLNIYLLTTIDSKVWDLFEFKAIFVPLGCGISMLFVKSFNLADHFLIPTLTVFGAYASYYIYIYLKPVLK
jgi:hypothetical protein